MKTPQCLLIRVGEIALKSPQVQRKFFKILLNNIKSGFESEKIKFRFETDLNRIFIYTKQIEKSIDILKKVFGITSISPVYVTDSNLKDICSLTFKIAKGKLSKKSSFAIRARRSGTHEFTSQEIAKEVGYFIKNKTKAKVDLENPEKEIFIECRQKKCYIFTEKIPGPGGMPLGTAGKIVCLISDVNSVIAAWMLMKRGCEVVFVYKNKKFLKTLKEWHIGKEAKIYEYKFSKKLYDNIVKKENANAIVTGESFPNVNFSLDKKIQTQVLRPLIGLNKKQCSEFAKKIGF